MKYVGGWWVQDKQTSAGNFLRRSKVIDIALGYVPEDRRKAVIQAGGHIGIWPVKLARHFEHVVTFEPDGDNWECMIANIDCNPRIETHPAVLGMAEGSRVAIQQSPKNTGKTCINERAPICTRTIPMMTIDSLKLPDVGAIFLDVEGYEFFALQGAIRTIRRCRPPVIVLEENITMRRYKVEPRDIAVLMGRFGYLATETYDEDVIYTLEGGNA